MSPMASSSSRDMSSPRRGERASSRFPNSPERSNRAAARSARVRTPPTGRLRSSLRRSPSSIHSCRSPSWPPSSARTFPRTTPLMPPADVPAITSTVTDSRLPVPGQLAQRLEVGRLGLVVAEGVPLSELADLVEPAGGPHQLVQLLGDPVHVDGERDAAVADQRQPELDAPRRPGGRPPGWAAGRAWSAGPWPWRTTSRAMRCVGARGPAAESSRAPKCPRALRSRTRVKVHGASPPDVRTGRWPPRAPGRPTTATTNRATAPPRRRRRRARRPRAPR